MLCDALMPQAWSPRHPSLSIFLQGGTLNDGAKDESNGQAWGGGQEESAERREKEILPEKIDISPKLFQGNLVSETHQLGNVWACC